MVRGLSTSIGTCTGCTHLCAQRPAAHNFSHRHGARAHTRAQHTHIHRHTHTQSHRACTHAQGAHTRSLRAYKTHARVQPSQGARYVRLCMACITCVRRRRLRTSTGGTAALAAQTCATTLQPRCNHAATTLQHPAGEICAWRARLVRPYGCTRSNQAPQQTAVDGKGKRSDTIR